MMNYNSLKFLTISYLAFFCHSSMAEWPTPNPDSCVFYSKLESQLSCKKQGVDYLSDYAPYYCQKFIRESATWSLAAQNWTKKTRKCLQETLYEQRNNPKFNCRNLEKIAFQTHSACYNEADLCQLEIHPIMHIFRVIKFKDYFKELRYADGGMLRLINYCLKRHLF